MQVRQQRGQIGSGLDRVNAVQFRLQRGNAQLVHGGRVHATGILIADFLLVCRARGGGRGGIFQNLPQVQPVQLGELREAAINRLVGGQWIALEPAVATVAVKVLAGVNGFVDEAGIEDAQFRCGGCSGGLGCGGCYVLLAECGNGGEAGNEKKGQQNTRAKGHSGDARHGRNFIRLRLW